MGYDNRRLHKVGYFAELMPPTAMFAPSTKALSFGQLAKPWARARTLRGVRCAATSMAQRFLEDQADVISVVGHLEPELRDCPSFDRNPDMVWL